ncbi:hypothetical protein [Halocola ammonii]
MRNNFIFAVTVDMRTARILIFFFITLTLFACRKEETRWKTKWKAPLAKGRLSLGDLVGDTLLSFDEGGLAHLIYENKLTNFDLDTLVKLPDTLVSQSYSLDIDGGPFDFPAGFVLVDEPQQTSYDLGGAELKTVRVKSGGVRIELRNYVDSKLQMSYNLVGADGPQGPLGYSIEADEGTPDNPAVYEDFRDISGYELSLTGIDGNDNNTLAANFLATVGDNEGETAIYGDDSVSVNISFEDVVIEYASGYFGQYENELVDTIYLDFFKNISPGILQLDEVNFDLSITNYVGMDAQVTFNELKSIRTTPENDVVLSHAFIGDQKNITRATDNNGNVSPTELEIEVNGDNSNIVDFTEIMPDKVAYDIDLNLNPLGDISLGNDFLYTDQSLETSLILDVPLCLAAENLGMRDTLELNNEPIEEWAQGSLFLKVENTFPFSANFDLSLLEEGNGETELIGSGEIAAATMPVGLDYLAQESISTIEVPAELVSRLHSENRIVINVTFDTANYPDLVKLREQYYMDIVLTGDIDYEITVE